MTEPRSDRQKDLGLEIPKRVIIAGCGGLGWNVAVGACLAGVEALTLIDDDVLELSNQNRILFPEEKLGEFKVTALAEALRACNPKAVVLPLPQKATIPLIDTIWDEDVLLDCTDDFNFQKELYQWSQQSGARYLRGGVTTNHYTISSSVPDWSFQGEEPEGRCGVHIPAWVSPCYLTTAYLLDKLLRRRDLELSGEL